MADYLVKIHTVIRIWHLQLVWSLAEPNLVIRIWYLQLSFEKSFIEKKNSSDIISQWKLQSLQNAQSDDIWLLVIWGRHTCVVVQSRMSNDGLWLFVPKLLYKQIHTYLSSIQLPETIIKSDINVSCHIPVMLCVVIYDSTSDSSLVILFCRWWPRHNMSTTTYERYIKPPIDVPRGQDIVCFRELKVRWVLLLQ